MMLKLFFIALPVFLALDGLWLGVVARSFYKEHIGHLLKAQVNWIAALVFYIIFVSALTHFVIQPAIAEKEWAQALVRGAFFGLATYAAYDLTNLAIAKDWPLSVTIVDLAWGMVLSAAVSVITYFFALRIG